MDGDEEGEARWDVAWWEGEEFAACEVKESGVEDEEVVVSEFFEEEGETEACIPVWAIETANIEDAALIFDKDVGAMGLFLRARMAPRG